MRLLLIAENISPTDFYDFYVLLHTFQRKHYGERHQAGEEIEQQLWSLGNYILDDHLNQLANILIRRLSDEKPAVVQVQQKYGIKLNQHGMPINATELPRDQQVALISELLPFESFGWFTGKTWCALGRSFLELAKPVTNLDSLIMAVDRLYNLMHHGGLITDFMDESNWLEDALNYRDNANFRQMLRKASSQVRTLVGRSAALGMDSSQVTDLQKLFTSFRREIRERDGIKVSLDGHKLVVEVESYRYAFDNNGQQVMLPVPVLGNKFSDLVARFVREKGAYKVSGGTSQAEISDHPNYLLIQTKFSALKVDKPINRQLKLANDLIWGLSGENEGHHLRYGIGASCIKPSYYYREGRRVTR